MAAERTVALGNPKGFHIRSISRLVELARQYDARVELAANGRIAGTGSAIGLLKLGAVQGTPVTVRAEGPQAEEAVAALARFLEEDQT